MTTICMPPRFVSSIEAVARILMLPRPVRYASMIPERPRIAPPVGKSGPLTNAMRSSVVAAGFMSKWIQASITSPKLCGGILVAIPTAIPCTPFTNKLGKRAGNTTGSSREPSYVGIMSTVFSSMSANRCIANGCKRHSVYRLAAGPKSGEP